MSLIIFLLMLVDRRGVAIGSDLLINLLKVLWARSEPLD